MLLRLYGPVVILPAVNEELIRLSAPMKVQAWIKQPPSWLAVVSPTVTTDPRLLKLDAGESGTRSSWQKNCPPTS